MSNRPHEVLTRDRLIEVLDYDEETGIFKWKKKLSSRGVVGKIAGTTSYGYSAINIDGVRYFSHRLAWLYFYGSWPNQEIDHIDRNRKNNAIKNLRDVNRIVNALNTGNRTDSTSGIKGVTFCKKRNQWQAQINLSGKNITLGRFDTIDEAAIAYKAANMVADHLMNLPSL
ncbi:HNH endonuclease [Citrobacter sp. BIDMC108]|uniref:HNH endonuclease n=1 Tax=Citrobacter sp. BIDMC108 TaxID=1686385 RepID=UPI0006508C84|nr:HNH endonuclease [Citrobacter sp. BIDMC108]